MTLLSHAALLGIIPLVLALFQVLTPRRAVLTGYLLAWLFLPMGGYSISGLPNYDKVAATTLPAMLGVMIFDSQRLRELRLRWFDVPTVIWCLCPIASSVFNDLGLYDGVSGALSRVIGWGLPYLMGRLYFNDEQGIKDLAVAIVIGGLLYVPLCLFEVRMSPQLHNMVYGYHQHAFIQHVRAGGYRPMVFMQHGLAVAWWMMAATLIAVALGWSGSRRRLFHVPMLVWAVPLLVTTVLCKSTGALLLLMMGAGVWMTARLWRPRPILLVMAVALPLYLAARVAGWSGDILTESLEPLVPPARVESLQFRLGTENARLTLIRHHLLLGTGRIGYASTEAASFKALDSMWIITLERYGVLGLASYMVMLLLPVAAVAARLPQGLLRSRAGAAVLALAVALLLYVIDKMVNAMTNPIFMLVVGGVSVYACANAFREVVLPGSRPAYVRVPAEARPAAGAA